MSEGAPAVSLLSPALLLAALSLLSSFAIAAALLHSNPRRTENRAFFLMTCFAILAQLVIAGVGFQDALAAVSHPRFRLTIGLGGIALYAMTLFSFAFPFNRRLPSLLLYGGGALALVQLAVSLTRFDAPSSLHFSRVYSGLMLTLACVFSVRNYRALTTSRERAGFLLVQISVLGRILLSALTFSVARSEGMIERNLLIFFTVVSPPLFAGLVAYGLTRFQLLSLRLMISRGLAYLLALGAALTTYFGLLWLLQSTLQRLLGIGHSLYATPLLLIALLVLFQPLQSLLLERLERRFDRSLTRAREATHAYLTRAPHLLELSALLQTVTETCQAITPGTSVGVILARPTPRLLTLATPGQLFRGGDDSLERLEDLDGCWKFPQGIELLHTLEHSRRSFLEQTSRRALPSDVPEGVRAIGFGLAIPLWQQGGVEGALLLNRPPPDRERRQCLLELSHHLGLQVENALLYQRALEANAALVRSNRDLEDTRLFLESLFESVPAGLAVLDELGCVVRWNRAMEKLTGIPRAEALAHHDMLELLPDLALQAERPDATRRGFTRPLKRRLKLESGDREAVVHMRLAMFRDREGHAGGTVLSLTDVTEQVKMQSALEQSRRLAALGEFAAAMAHELRTPLTSIQLNMQILAGKVTLPAEDYEYFDIVLTEIERLNRTISEILDYARPLRLNLAETSLSDLVDEVVRGLYFFLAERGVTVVQEPDPLLQLSLDPERFKQVLINLLDNASHAVAETAARLRAEGAEEEQLEARGVVRIQAQRSRGPGDVAGVRLEIQDRGCGIPSDKLTQIFDPFVTLRAAGTGLGLAISKKIVEAHQGTIGVSSTLGEGATFTIWLPLHAG